MHSALCRTLSFKGHYAIKDAAEVALEDYACAMTRARTASVIRLRDLDLGLDLVKGVHLCAPEIGIDDTISADIEGFAHSLMAAAVNAPGLGWS